MSEELRFRMMFWVIWMLELCGIDECWKWMSKILIGL